MLQKLSEISDNPRFRNIESILYIGEERARVGAKAKSVEAAWMQPNPPLTSILLWILLPNGNVISYTGNICNIGQLRNKRVVYYPLSFSKFSFKVHIGLKTVTGFRSKDDIPWADIHDRGGTVNGLLNVRSTGRVESTLNPGICLQITPSVTIQGIMVGVKKINHVKPRSGSYLPPTQVYMETPSTSPASMQRDQQGSQKPLNYLGSKSSCSNLPFVLFLCLHYLYLIDNHIVSLHPPLFGQVPRIYHFDWASPGCWAWCAWSVKRDPAPALVEISVKY